MEQKKQNKLFNIIFGVFVVVVVVIAAIYLKNQVKPEVSINGQTLRVGMTVQDLVDAGFSVGISMTGSGGLNLDVQPQVPGEKYSSTSNGIDVGGMEKEEALRAFEKLGVKFDKDDKEEFLSGEYGFIIGKSGEYSFELETDDANEVIESIRAKLRV